MTISDANWNSSTDPFRQGAPDFNSIPSPNMVSTTLTYMTFTGKYFLSGVIDDEDRQTIVLVKDSDNTVESMDQFHCHADRTIAGGAEWKTYSVRYTGGDGAQRSATVGAHTIVLHDSDETWRLSGTFSSFPNNEYRIRAERYPCWWEQDGPQTIVSLGMHFLTELTPWDDSATGTHFEPREFMDKASFQAASPTAERHTLRFIAVKGKTITELIEEVMGQTPHFYAIRPNNTTNDAKVTFHCIDQKSCESRSDLVLQHRTMEASPHVLGYDLRRNVLEPITGYDFQYGAYQIRENNDTSVATTVLKNDFPLDYKTGEDRLSTSWTDKNIAKLEFPHVGIAEHDLALGGVLAQFPLYRYLKAQDELSIDMDWFGLNYLPGDIFNVFLENIGYDDTNGRSFQVMRTRIKDAKAGVVQVTARTSYGIANPHPYLWRDETTTFGSKPAEDWPFLFSVENLGAFDASENVFTQGPSLASGTWINAFAEVRERSDYSTLTDQHMTENGAAGALYQLPSNSNAPFNGPSVSFITGGIMDCTGTSFPVNGTNAILWWIWNPVDLSLSGRYLIEHTYDANNSLEVYSNGTANQFRIRVKNAGTTTTTDVSCNEDQSSWVMVRFDNAGGGRNKVLVNGSSTSGNWTAFPGIGTNDVNFGWDGSSALGIAANIAEIGCVSPQGATETISTFASNVQAYLEEKATY